MMLGGSSWQWVFCMVPLLVRYSTVTGQDHQNVSTSTDSNVGVIWKEVAFKLMPLNATGRGITGSDDENYEMVPHIWSKRIADEFLPCCDPSDIAAHLMCREGGFASFTSMTEVDGSSYSSSHFVRLDCKPWATKLEDCYIRPVDGCNRLAEIQCGNCGGEVVLDIDSDPVTVKSPGFPNRIFPFVECKWHFISSTAENPLTIEFEEFDLPVDCKFAGVTIGSLLRTGYMIMLGKTFCGRIKPPDYESESTVAVLKYSSSPGTLYPGNIHNRGFRAIVSVKDTKDEVHLSVALGFTAAILVILIIIAALYHNHISKAKRRNEYMSKKFTRDTLHRGSTSPDHVYCNVPGPEKLARPATRQPLKTIFVQSSGQKKPALPPRSPSAASSQLVPSRSAKKEVSFYIPMEQPVAPVVDEVDSEYVSPNPSFVGLPPKHPPKQSPLSMQNLKSVFGIHEPFSDGFLARRASIKRKDRASSFPLLGDSELPNPKASPLHFGEPTYVSLKSGSSDKNKGRGSSKITPSSMGNSNFYTPVGSAADSPSVPVINLEDCNGSGGCTFVKTIKPK